MDHNSRLRRYMHPADDLTLKVGKKIAEDHAYLSSRYMFVLRNPGRPFTRKSLPLKNLIPFWKR